MKLDKFSPLTKDIVVTFLPLALSAFASCVIVLIERIFLASYSTEALEAFFAGYNVSRIFYFPLMAVPLMAQLFIGRYLAGHKKASVGPCIWQLIWFAFFSFLLTLPLSLALGKYYFHNNPIEKLASQYFYLLIPLNLFAPLTAALSTFFVEIGKSRWMIIVTTASNIFNLLLSFILIFGIDSWILPMGVRGAGVGTVVSQGLLTLTLGAAFLRKSYRESFRTDLYSLRLKELWEYLSLGLLSAGARFLGTTSSAAVTWLILQKGSDFIFVLSIGGTLAIFNSFIGDSLYQSIMNIASRFIGTRQQDRLIKLVHKAFLFLFISTAVMAIPFLLFPKAWVPFLFSETQYIGIKTMLFPLLLGNWISFFVYTFNAIPNAFIVAFKDLKFALLMGFMTWMEFVCIYIALELIEISPQNFFSTHAATVLLCESCFLYYRTYLLNKRAKEVIA